MCVDFTDINKTCPKDHYALSSIERLVDSISGHVVVSFLDVFSRYHQILIEPKDFEKTTFIIDEVVFCYEVMPFGLKNAGATYQRLVTGIFKDLIGTLMEVYIDNMIVKRCTLKGHPSDIQQVLDILDKTGMKLNPEKYTFGVKLGNFQIIQFSKAWVKITTRWVISR